MSRIRQFIDICALVTVSPLLWACPPSLDNQLKHTVMMKYAHAANVQSFQGGVQNLQYSGVQNGSFWAIFDVCTVDVQGSALGGGFPYDAGKFYVASGPANYGPSNPGNVNAGGAAVSSQSPQVL